MQVVYEGIRLTPEEIVAAARKQKAHVIGLSVLSGSHLPLVQDVVARMKAAALKVPLVVGGIIPPEDALALEQAGVAAVYTPKDFELNRIMADVVRIVERANGASNVWRRHTIGPRAGNSRLVRNGWSMSGLPPKAASHPQSRNVRAVPEAAIRVAAITTRI